MIASAWLRGLVAQRRGRLLATAARRRRRRRAARVDRRLPLGDDVEDDHARDRARAASTGRSRRSPGATPADAAGAGPRRSRACARAAGRLRRDHRALSATTGGSTQRTGPGMVLGLPDGYARGVPRRAPRRSPGSATGVLLAQQTAANLHARPGDTVDDRPRRRPPGQGDASTASSTCPTADSLFQQVGAPPGAQPQAPPDNVVLLPRRDASSRARAARPARARRSTRALDHARCPAARAPPSPASAGRARNLETKLAGGGLVGDNLGTALDQARQDALYAELLFLFLGVPGAILAGLVTASIAAAGADRRRRDARPAAHARRVDARSSCGSRWPRPRSPARLGVVARARRARCSIGAAALRHRELRRRHARRASCGRAAPRSPGC